MNTTRNEQVNTNKNKSIYRRFRLGKHKKPDSPHNTTSYLIKQYECMNRENYSIFKESSEEVTVPRNMFCYSEASENLRIPLGATMFDFPPEFAMEIGSQWNTNCDQIEDNFYSQCKTADNCLEIENWASKYQ